MGPNRTLQDPRVPYKTPKELLGGILWDWYLIKVLNIVTCTIVYIGTLHCIAIKKEMMQYNTMQVTKQRLDQSKLNDAKLLILGLK